MTKISFLPNVADEIRAIEQNAALSILHAIHRYADIGEGHVKALTGDFAGLMRLRVGRYRVVFEQTDGTIIVHRVRDRKSAYR